MEFLRTPLILKQFESSALIPMQEFEEGIYYAQVQTNNNALLSSLLVSDVENGASVVVNYFQTSAANEKFERTDITSHNTFTAPSISAQQIIVSRIHNKVIAEIIIVGGKVTCGVFCTAVGYSISDIDTQLKLSGTPVNFLSDKGLPVLSVDEKNEFAFLKTNNGSLLVEEKQGGEPVYVFNEIENIPQNSEEEIFEYTVPNDKEFFLKKIQCSGQNIAVFSCFINNNLIAKKWSWFSGGLTVDFDFNGIAVKANSGDVVKCLVNHSRPFVGNFSGSLLGVLK